MSGGAYQAAFRWLDVSVVIQSDAPDVIGLFDRAYERFRTTAVDAPALVCQVWTSPTTGGPALVLNGQRFPVQDSTWLPDYAYTRILNAALAQVQSHYLFHAAALSHAGQGLLLAGPAGRGKTTLTLALLDRGYTFLSDDLAAIGRADGWLHPFPRRLGVRPGAWALLGDARAPHERELWDVESLRPGALGTACPARFLFALADPGDNAPAEPALYLTLDRLDAALLADLRAIAGVDGVTTLTPLPTGEPVRVSGRGRGEEQWLPVVRLDVTAGADVEPAIEAVCARHGRLLLDAARGAEAAPPDFTRSPDLEPLAPAEGAWELLRRLRGGAHSALVQQVFDGRLPRLYLALAELAAGMACYRLTVGRLTEMVALIDEVTSC